MTSLHHRIATKWLEKQPSVRVASLWLSGVCFKVANRKKDFLNRARQVAEYWHQPEYATRAKQLVKTEFPVDKDKPEEGTYQFPSTNPEYYNFALDHLGAYQPHDIANMIRDFDTYSKRQSPEVKKQLLNDLKSIPFSSLRNRIPPASSDKEKKKDSEKIYEDDRWRVVVPLSHKSMRGHGVNTGWCISTANPGYARQYRENDNLHLFAIDKTKPGKDQKGKYALTFNENSRADVRDTYDKEGPGHQKPPEKAMQKVAKTLGMPDEVRDQAWSNFKEKQGGLTERMKKYPRGDLDMTVELNAALIYEDSVSADQLQQLEDIQGGDFYEDLDPDAKFLITMKDQNLKNILPKIHEDFGDEGLAAYLFKISGEYTGAFRELEHLSVDPKRLEKDTGISQDTWKKVLQEINEVSEDPKHPNYYPSEKVPAQGRRKTYQTGFESTFKEWAQIRYPGKSIPNPNPTLKSDRNHNIEVTTLFDYASNKDPEHQARQQAALQRKKKLWNKFHYDRNAKRHNQQNEKQNTLKSRKLQGHSSGEDGSPFKGEVSDTAVTAPGSVVKNDARVIEHSYIGNGAEISGKAQVLGKAQVSGGEISGKAQVLGKAQVSGGEISGNAKVYGEAVVTGGKISGGRVYDNAQVSGGTISGGAFGGDCEIRGGNWNRATLRLMSEMPEYGEHFSSVLGALISGEWDDVPEDVKKKIEEENAG